MATTIKFTEEKRHMNYSLDEFQWLRRTVMRLYGYNMDSFFISSMVDKLDLVRDLKPGCSIYFVPSKYECYTDNDIESLEKWCNGFDSRKYFNYLKDEEKRENYRPMLCNAFCIKRTNKLWVLRSLDYEYKH